MQFKTFTTIGIATMAGPQTSDTGSQTIAELISSRRTIHDFQPEPIPDALIIEAIESARWAPNHRVTEPWHFYVVGQQTAAEISHLNFEITREVRGESAAQAKLQRWLSIPSWLVVTCDRSQDETRWREDYAACCCAIQNLSLRLWSEGVGIKWTTGPVTRHPRFHKLIGSDVDLEDVVGLIWLGYSSVIPSGNRAKSVDEITKRLP